MPRTLLSADFPAAAVAASKGSRRVSVVIPARDEAATVGRVVGEIRRRLVEDCPVVDELVVVDDGSADDTAGRAAAAGARVVRAGDVWPEHDGPGKGQAMWKGLAVTSGEVVAFCDADVQGFDAAFVLGLVGPLLADPALVLVKGCYERPLGEAPGEGGRVTELAARPALALLHPGLAGLDQPLAGECAGRREVLEAVPFVGGYGVEMGLILDVAAGWGVERIAQCDLGRRVHRNRPLSELGPQALAVWQVALQRAGWTETALPWSTALRRPSASPSTVTMTELPPLSATGGRRPPR